MTLLSIFVVVIAILLSLLILIIGSVVDIIRANAPDIPDEPNNDKKPPISSDGVQYTQITKAKNDIRSGELILVNADHAYVFPTTTNHLINIYDNRTKINGSNPYQINTQFAIYLHKDAFSHMEDMMKKYYEISDGDGSVLIKYSYRSKEDQEKLTTSPIKPGYSDHHTGYCVALHQGNASNFPALNTDHWIYQNSYKYGFIVRYPESKSEQTGVSSYEHCFRYVGIPHATYISQSNLCLEEYVELLKNNYTSTHLAIVGADGNSYEVYYVPAGSGDITTISVPSNYEYTVSGDNVGGFIVTVHLSEPKA